MSRRFFVEQEAWDDVDRYVRDYEAQQVGVGIRFKKQHFMTFDRIEHFPFMYAKVRGRLRFADVRRFPFAVVYIVRRAEITVVDVIPTRSNPAKWFRKR